MGAADNYFDDGFDQDRAEVDGARTLIQDRLLPVFQDFFVADADGGRWTYEVVDHRAGRQVTTGSYSTSTNAMILFALAVVTGRIPASPLSPRPQLPIRITNANRIDGILEQGIAGLVSHARDKHFETHSGTFGRNDPLSLAWILELLQCFRGIPPGTARSRGLTTDAMRLAAAIEGFAELAITHACEKPAGPHLIFDFPGDIPSQPLEHAFPPLRVVHVYKILERSGHEPQVRIWDLGRYFIDRLHMHLSYSEMPNGAFDPGELAFSLEGALLCNANAVEPQIIDRTLQVFARGEYWRSTRPTVVTARGHIHMPISVEIANSLLRVCDLADTRSNR